MYKFAGYLVKVSDTQHNFAPNRETAVGFCRSSGIDQSNIQTCYTWDKLQPKFTNPENEDIIKED